MKNKKNIDKLFDDSFKNFEATPSSRVWENIQTELNKEKKERKVIPLWIKYGGIAAVLALMLTVGNWMFQPIETIPNSITNENSIDSVEKTNNSEDFINSEITETQVATESEKTENSLTEDINSTIHNVENSTTQGVVKSTNNENNSTQEVVATSDANSKNNSNSSENKRSSKSSENSIKNEIVTNNIQNKDSDEDDNQAKIINGEYQKKNNQKEVAFSKNNSKLPENKNDKTDSYKISDEGNESFLKNENLEIDSGKDRISATEKSESIEGKILESEIKEDSNNKKSILDAIAETENTDDNSLKNEKQKPEKRWNVMPNVAPVYYSSFGNGSSIDPDFSNSPQKGDVNMSYGLQVSYALSNRLSVRTGLNNMDLSYSTSDIFIGTGPVSDALASVDYGSRQIVVTALSRMAVTGDGSTHDFGDITLKSTDGNAQLIQNINYYEVPLELKYALINNKFGINVIGGVSTLFLGNNEISVKSDNFSSVLGEANNLSSVSFSTNVGLGLDYKLSKRFTFNIEPMFKYQLNPYTDSSVNFKPYYLGVYSGLSFKF